MFELTPGGADRVTLVETTWREVQGEFVGTLKGPPPQKKNSPSPVLQGCLPEVTCSHPPWVASDLTYCNSQVRAKLDTDMVISHVWLQGCKKLVLDRPDLNKKQNFKIPTTSPIILLSKSALFPPLAFLCCCQAWSATKILRFYATT